MQAVVLRRPTVTLELLTLLLVVDLDCCRLAAREEEEPVPPLPSRNIAWPFRKACTVKFLNRSGFAPHCTMKKLAHVRLLGLNHASST